MNEEELAERMEKLSDNYDDSLWGNYRSSVRKNVLSEEDNPREFINWPAIMGTMFVGENGGTSLERKVVDLWFDDPPDDPLFGKPPILPEDTTSNAIRQLRHIAYFEKNTGEEVRHLESVVEFGGGYGMMAYLFAKLGFLGEYVIYDFPELLLIQEYYLSNTLDDQEFDQIGFVTNIDELPQYTDLVIALDSITEVEEIPYRHAFLDSVTSWMYMMRYLETEDNIEWSRGIREAMSEYEWEIVQDLVDENKVYLFGVL